jgi:hypothetical protein
MVKAMRALSNAADSAGDVTAETLGTEIAPSKLVDLPKHHSLLVLQ